MELIINLARFIIILGVLIFIHELGHFLVAKKVGIYVFRFSVGFGKQLLKWKRSGTEYCLSLIPFGGYVKMAGQSDIPGEEDDTITEEDDPDLKIAVPEDQKFCNKTVLERLGVVIAGPAMNFLLGLVLFIIVYMFGMHVPSYMKQTTIGGVMEDSPAEKAGLMVGDEITHLNGEPISEWREITRVTLFNIGEPLEVTIKRGNNELVKQITPDYYSDTANPGIGVLPYVEPTIKEIISGSPAAQADLQPGDSIVAVNGEPSSFTSVAEQIRHSGTHTIDLKIIRNGQEHVVTITPNVIGGPKGITLAEHTVVELDKNLHPDLELGDTLISLNSEKFESLVDTEDPFRPYIGQTIKLGFERKIHSFLKTTTASQQIDAYIDSGYKIGVYFEPSDATVLEKYPVHIAIWKGAKRTFMSVYELFASLYYLAVGRISPKELAGPVGIYKITADFAKSGFIMLLSLVAFLSVNLSVINLLPIPVLDGGHVLFLTIEGILRRPLNRKVVETCQKIGFFLLMGLIGLTLYNDIVHRIFGK